MNGATILVPSALGARSKRFIANYWKLVERYRIAFLSGVPTTLSVLIANPPRNGEDISSFRPYSPTGSAPLPAEVARRIEDLFGVRMLATYGATEFTQNATMVPRDGDPRYGATGIHLPYVQVKTAMLDGKGGIARDCKVDEIGAILVKGPNTIPGYVDPALDKTIFFGDGWVHSGDLGRLDEDGYLFITGRSKDLIIRGGHNIDPALIEEALMAHPAVAFAGAIGQPDAHAGELPCVYVELQPGATADPADLQAFARGAHRRTCRRTGRNPRGRANPAQRRGQAAQGRAAPRRGATGLRDRPSRRSPEWASRSRLRRAASGARDSRHRHPVRQFRRGRTAIEDEAHRSSIPSPSVTNWSGAPADRHRPACAGGSCTRRKRISRFGRAVGRERCSVTLDRFTDRFTR